MTKQVLQQPLPVDRSEAVNLARNMLTVHECKGITDKGVRVLCEAVMAMDSALAQQGEQPSFSDWEVFAMQEQKQRAEVHRDKLLSMLEELLDALGCGDSAIEIEAGELIDEINKWIDRS